jgi:hypothetical protein
MRTCAAGNDGPSARITAPFTGESFADPASIAIAVDARDADGHIARVDFYAGPMHIGSDTTAPFRITWHGARPGTHHLYVVAHDQLGATTTSATVDVVVTPPPIALAAPWATQDIGATGLAGTAWMEDGRVIVEGAGIDIWNTSDEFRYVYQPLAGDGEIVARVAAVEAISTWTKAGVMIRQSLEPSSPHAFMLVSSGKGLAFQRRRTAGTLSVHTSGGSGTAPAWVKLARAGSTVTASRSSDGVSWTVVGKDTLPLGPTAYIGLAVVSRDRARLATAAFESVVVRAGAAPDASAPPSLESSDIGAVGVKGAFSVTGDTVTVSGAGADVWGTADAFRFAYRRLDGDGRIVARVAAVEAVAPWTKAGVMMRQSLAANAPHAFMLVSASKGLAFQRRKTAGGSSIHTSGGTGHAPRWVQLVRTGQTITASVSADGVTWKTVGESTFSMPGAIWVGLAVSSHDATRSADGTFTNVRIYD